LPALCALFGLGACRAAAPGPETKPEIKVVADDPALLDGPGATHFSLPRVRDLHVRYALAPLPDGVTWATVRLLQPGGAVYHVRHLPIAREPAPAQVASPDGVPRPIDVLRPRPLADGREAVDFAIAVAGTNLLRRPVAGTWEVRAALDGQPDSEAALTLDFGMTR
jgi:hypothetical protein